MPKALAISGMGVAGLLLLVFLLDLAIGIPFGKAHFWADVFFLVAALVLGYMAWSTYREVA